MSDFEHIGALVVDVEALFARAASEREDPSWLPLLPEISLPYDREGSGPRPGIYRAEMLPGENLGYAHLVTKEDIPYFS